MKVFISYRSTDRELVKELMSDLSDMGHQVWYDQALQGGQVWWDEILENIRNCDVLLFALTPRILDSRPCQLEYTYANALNKHIIPVLLDQGVALKLLPSILQERQIVNYINRDKSSFKTLSTALRNLPPTPALPDPLPTPPPAPLSPLVVISEQLDEPSLTYEQQAALLHQLKGYREDPENAADAYALLQRLSQHPTLLAAMYREVEQILAAWPTEPASNKVLTTEKQASPQQPKPIEITDDAPRFHAWRIRGILDHVLEGWLTVTANEIYFAPNEQEKADLSVTIGLSDIRLIKKATVSFNPVVKIEARNGAEYSFCILQTDTLTYGDRDAFISVVEQVRGQKP